MSAEILRRAAALMRERAKAATESAPEPWTFLPLHEEGCCGEVDSADGWMLATHRATATHIASWHPAVALAVADWLDMVADYIELALDGRHPGWRATKHHALAVARAYLGEAADD